MIFVVWVVSFVDHVPDDRGLDESGLNLELASPSINDFRLRTLSRSPLLIKSAITPATNGAAAPPLSRQKLEEERR